VAALAVVAGCDSGPSDRAPVRGSVRYGGQPVDQGGIAFIPVGDAQGAEHVRAAAEIKDGQYELDARHGPSLGKNRVQITWRKKTGRQLPGERGHVREETVQAIPPRYNTQTELIRDVQPKPNTFDFDLPK
jgi:hypothetical protein